MGHTIDLFPVTEAGRAGARASIFHSTITGATKYDVLEKFYFDDSRKVWRLACDITDKAKTQII